jgi:hypothetical protein
MQSDEASSIPATSPSGAKIGAATQVRLLVGQFNYQAAGQA